MVTTSNKPATTNGAHAAPPASPETPASFVTPEKQQNYATERYAGATGLNWYTSSPSLQFLMRYYMTDDDLAWAEPHLSQFGELCGGPISERAEITDKNPPRLVKYDKWGNDISEVVLPETVKASKRDLLAHGFRTIAKSEGARARGGAPVMMGAAYSYLLHQAEIGMACATGMTGGVAALVDRYAPPDIREWALPKLNTGEWDGAMLLTERTGGSDLGALETTATPNGDSFLLNGFKWFASNGDGKAIATLAKPVGAPDNVKGIGLYLVLKERRDGSRNSVYIRQLKDKLGTRAVPSTELEFVNAEAFLLSGGKGMDGHGMSRMMEMVTDSRVGVASMGIGCARRALVEALCYARTRSAFGKRLIDQPLMRRKLAEMIVDLEGSEALVFEAHGTPNRSRARQSLERMRLTPPLCKLKAARLGITMASDAIEVHGGNGYVETWPVARILRDSQVNTLWEGTDNILYLDIRRGIERDAGDEQLLDRVDEALSSAGEEVSAKTLVERRALDLRDAIATWKAMDRELAESRLAPLSQFMADVLAAAYLVEQGAWEQRELGSTRKALVAKLYAERHLADHRLGGVDASPDLEAHFDELLAGALVDDRPR
ncbi:MAG: acyl-CoA dehydrogenase family protein [Dehalococcoidia bacterium]